MPMPTDPNMPLSGAVEPWKPLCPKPGFYRIPVDKYHEDPCPEPSLSGSIIKVLLEQSPLHAAVRHPRLSKHLVRSDDDKFNIGTAAHTLLLGKGKDFVIPEGEHKNWQRNIEGMKSAAWKAQIRASGRVPILDDQLTATNRMVTACREQLIDRGIRAFEPGEGEGEVTMVWLEGQTWCRALLDWLPFQPRRRRVLYDYKSTSASAHPDAWGGRTAWGIQFDIQDAFTSRGFRKLMGMKPPADPEYVPEGAEFVFGPDDPQFRFVVQETAFPHCICVFQLSPPARHMAQRKVDAGLKIWRECMELDEWPAYPNRVIQVSPPEYLERKWLEREHSGEFDGNSVEALIEGFRP